MRTAVAIDGQQRVWVFWSENRKSNFDIYAKSYTKGKWSKETRLTTDAGTDVNPVAATDSAGRVWVAWQGFRDGNLEVLAAAQEGERFTAESTVSFSKLSDWDPSIAAAPNGEIAIAWDTYDKGDYDVYFRRVRMNGGIKMDAPVPVAASQNFEARSSIAYDRQSRLWVAYEVSDLKWGKDTGPYGNKQGIPLYRDHSAKVKVFQGANVFEPSPDSLKKTLPLAQNPAGQRKKQAPADEHDTAGNMAGRMSLNNFPRLAVDVNGAVYLAFRSRSMPGRTPEGSVWVQQLTYFDGSKWIGPIVVPNSDQWSDNRPALLSTAPGHLMMILTTDHRQSELLRDRRPGKRNDNTIPDSVNADLYAAEMRVNASAQSQLTAAAAETVAAPDSDVKPEQDQIAMLHHERVPVGSDKLQIMRGEFHRHTELSVDGNGDGPVDRCLSVHDRCRRHGLGRRFRSRQRHRRVSLVAAAENDRRVQAGRSVCIDVRVRAQRQLSGGSPQHGLRAARHPAPRRG